jgi:hypothetical protein
MMRDSNENDEIKILEKIQILILLIIQMHLQVGLTFEMVHELIKAYTSKLDALMLRLA